MHSISLEWISGEIYLNLIIGKLQQVNINPFCFVLIHNELLGLNSQWNSFHINSIILNFNFLGVR